MSTEHCHTTLRYPRFVLEVDYIVRREKDGWHTETAVEVHTAHLRPLRSDGTVADRPRMDLFELGLLDEFNLLEQIEGACFDAWEDDGGFDE